MRCWNCNREIPDTTKACQFCEAMIEREADADERGIAAQEAFEQLPAEAQETLYAKSGDTGTADEFARNVMVGSCPKCGSSDTDDLSEDPEVADICLARCYGCGHHWCLECGKAVDKYNPHCDCIADDELYIDECFARTCPASASAATSVLALR